MVDVVAIEDDVLPAERGNVGEQLIGRSFGLSAVALVFEDAVPDLPVMMDKQGAGLCLAYGLEQILR